MTVADLEILLTLVSRAIEHIQHGNPKQAAGTLEEVAFLLRELQREVRRFGGYGKEDRR